MSSYQSTESFLAQRFSNRGGAPLPYAESSKPVIRQHLVELTREFPSLGVGETEYTYNDGRTVQLLQIKGTLPMYYRDKKFNIPISIYIPERYPQSTPIVYVVPTSDMIIKQGHNLVDPNGIVTTQLMRNWSSQRSDLLNLCQDMSICFGQEPPVYAKPPNFQQSVAQQPPPPPMGQQTHGYAYPYPPRGQPQPQPYPPRPYGQPAPLTYGQPQRPPVVNYGNSPIPNSQYPGQQQQQPPFNFQNAQQAHQQPIPVDLKKEFQKVAQNSLTNRVQGSIKEYQLSMREEMVRLCEKQSLLESRSKEIDEGLNTYKQEKEGLEQSVKSMSELVGELDRWLSLHEPRQAKIQNSGSQDSVDPDAAIVAADGLSNQALDCQARDMAVEDCLLALDKGLQKGALSIEQYLKQVRNLTRKQFFARALATKVASTQSAQPPPPPGQPGAMAMATGDSWVNASVMQPPVMPPPVIPHPNVQPAPKRGLFGW